jgi:hypothetical protein
VSEVANSRCFRRAFVSPSDIEYVPPCKKCIGIWTQHEADTQKAPATRDRTLALILALILMIYVQRASLPFAAGGPTDLCLNERETFRPGRVDTGVGHANLDNSTRFA